MRAEKVESQGIPARSGSTSWQGGHEAGVLVKGSHAQTVRQAWKRVGPGYSVGDGGPRVGGAIPELPEVGPLVVERCWAGDHGVPAHQAEGEGGVQVIAGVWLCPRASVGRPGPRQ